MPNPTPDPPKPRPLESHRRPLRASEERSLRGKLGSLKSQSRRASKASLWFGTGLFAVFWILTLLASDVPWVVVTGFWLLVGTGIMAWVRRGLAREVGELSGMALGFESAMRRNEVEVYDVRASAFVELEEVEDEGACYAFDLGDGRIAFLSGQEFYSGAGFPSLDFSLAYVLDEEDRVVDMLIEKRGPRAAPARTIPSGTKWALTLPESLSVIVGSLEDLEGLLGFPD